jgi:hypothetical protein
VGATGGGLRRKGQAVALAIPRTGVFVEPVSIDFHYHHMGFQLCKKPFQPVGVNSFIGFDRNSDRTGDKSRVNSLENVLAMHDRVAYSCRICA